MSTNRYTHKIQLNTIRDEYQPLHLAAPHCRPRGVHENTGTQTYTPIQLLFTLTVRMFPEDGSLVPKPVGLDIHHELYFVVS